MLQMKKIDRDNLDNALKTYHSVFSWLPEDSDPYSDIILKNAMTEMRTRYYMVYDDEKLVGITGNYIVPEDPESAFLGWFGILPEMRRYHFGSKVLKVHEERLKEEGYRFSRLYTESQNNEATCAFYERNGYIAEEYDCPEEPALLKGLVRTYSKSLGDWPLEPWNSRNMNLAAESKMMYSEEYV